ncbi:phospholipase A2-like [Microplitis demolitor]|uniref:phospholipase A2-like n=1 Tax=Microplitis demolitor TaxID=69319 RepID=UPI00235B6953|nr:phospholipase A2-like [Microplitis demolitor]
MFGKVSIVFTTILIQINLLHCWSINFYLNDDNGLRENQNERFNLIFPGTKWCGSGSIAENYNDLGYFRETDACCRMHDHCDETIEAMQTRHGLTNPSYYTRVHCSCDEKFYDCLHGTEENISQKVGTVYFSVLNTQCFRNDFPIISCKKYIMYPKRCIEYDLDRSQDKIYQWFDVPLY